ncbi:hypothetical protein C4D60_Mb03t17120 [Musa balbisiana]|uniref:Metallothionein n=1 Tax=Musa balbisiana TaxID=52838 RepID=A0A4V6T4C8_MUSBA|nr:hypothetical protein C4D60_Mb03t17120 [Musa balbisiana]
MSTCGNCDCVDKSQCVYVDEVVVAAEAAEHDGKCKCGAACACTDCKLQPQGILHNVPKKQVSYLSRNHFVWVDSMEDEDLIDGRGDWDVCAIVMI